MINLLGPLVAYAAYFVVAAGVAVLVHGFVRNSRVASGFATLISAALLLLFLEWSSHFADRPGWVFPILIPGCVVAFPASAVVGRAFDGIRAVRPRWDDFPPSQDLPPEWPASR